MSDDKINRIKRELAEGGSLHDAKAEMASAEAARLDRIRNAVARMQPTPIPPIVRLDVSRHPEVDEIRALRAELRESRQQNVISIVVAIAAIVVAIVIAIVKG